MTELTRVVHVACSWYHSVALTDVGLLYSWGDGSDGALGHGANESVLRPRMVEYVCLIHVSYTCVLYMLVVLVV